MGPRLDILEESAACVRALLRDDVATFAGEHFTLTDARNEPRPVQDALPIWIGGSGERRTLRIAARYADGWNVPFISPEIFAHKKGVLAERCAEIGRDPGEIRCSVNVGLAFDEDALQRQFGGLAEATRPGVLTGSGQQIVDGIGRYVEAGADQINLAMRAPFEIDGLETLAAAVPVRPPGASSRLTTRGEPRCRPDSRSALSGEGRRGRVEARHGGGGAGAPPEEVLAVDLDDGRHRGELGEVGGSERVGLRRAPARRRAASRGVVELDGRVAARRVGEHVRRRRSRRAREDP